MTAEAPPTAAPGDSPASTGAPRARWWRRLLRPRHPWLVSLAVVLVVLVATEGYVRQVERQLPTLRAGDAAEMIIKARQVEALAADGGSQIDIVVFGTSMMDSATSPSTLLAQSGRYDRIYNASVVGAPLATQVRWADEIVLEDLDPDLIVLGVHPVDLLLTDVLNLNIRPAQADVIFARVLRETSDGPLPAADRFLHEQLALVRQRGSLRQPRIMWDATLRMVNGDAPPGEFALRDEAYWFEHLTPLGESSQFAGDPFEITGIGSQLKEKLDPSGFATSDLVKMLEVAQGSGARVVIVIPPVPLDSWRQVGIDMAALDAGVALIESIAAGHDVPVLDFSSAGYPNEQFADMMHSNDTGAVRFSTDLAARLDALAATG